MEKTTPRLPHIDVLKTIAIYFVLVFHGTLYPVNVTAEMSFGELFLYGSRSILSTCVPLFFFVNGYLLLSRPMNLKRHTIRTLKLVLVGFFWIGFLLLVLQPYYDTWFTWETFWQEFWYLKGGWNNQLWYLGVLVSIYLFFPLIKSVFDKDRSIFLWFSGVCMVLVFGKSLLNEVMTLGTILLRRFQLYQGFPFFHIFDPVSGNFGIGIVYFCLGGIAVSLEERLLQIPARVRNTVAGPGLLLGCTGLALMGWKFSQYLGYPWELVWFGYDTVFTAWNVLCLYVLALNRTRESRLLQIISANTLGIYLIHDLFHKALTPMTFQYPLLRTLPGTLVYALVLLVLSLLVSLVLKKIPLLRQLV